MAIYRAKYRDAVEAIKSVQRRHSRPFRRRMAKKIVKRIMLRTGMKEDIRHHYFWLWAVCALIGQESMCQYWQKTRRKK